MAAISLADAGCGKKMPEYIRIQGTVYINDQPEGGVHLQFHPDGAYLPDSGGEGRKSAPPRLDGCKSDPDGSYLVLLHGPGKYTVTAYWPRVTILEGEEIEGEDQLLGSFRDPRRSVMKITVQKGDDQTMPLRLTYP